MHIFLDLYKGGEIPNLMVVIVYDIKNYFEDFKIDRSNIFVCDKCQFIEKSSIN